MTDEGRALEALEALERQMAASGEMAAGFSAELAGLQRSMTFTGREVALLSGGIGRGLRRAFDGLVLDGMRLSDALEGVGRAMLDSVYRVATRPVQDAVAGSLAQGINALAGGLLPFAAGAGFAQGRVMPFAAGGVVTAPTAFPLRGATGLMGEAGPEAILPLRRGADGRLGVAAGGSGRAVNVTMHVTTPDAAGFARSRGQIAAELGRALARGERNR